MSKPFAALLSLAALAALLPLGSAPAGAAGSPILINHCFVTQPKPLSKVAGGTQIGYVNNSHQTATKVTFRVAYQNSENHYVRAVTDVGQFQPGVAIDHHFALYNDVTYGGKHVQSCNVTQVVFSNGSIWRAP